MYTVFNHGPFSLIQKLTISIVVLLSIYYNLVTLRLISYFIGRYYRSNHNLLFIYVKYLANSDDYLFDF